MQFHSITNYFLHAIRIVFVFVCFIFLLIILGVIKYPVPISSFIPWYARIIIVMGMIWGMIFPALGLISGTNKIIIIDDTIIIKKVFLFRETTYNIGDIKQVKEVHEFEPWVPGNQNGIRVRFTNGDEYLFMSYNFLNYKKLKATFFSVTKKNKIMILKNNK